MTNRRYAYRGGPQPSRDTTGSILAGTLTYAPAKGAARRRTARATLDAAKSEAEFQADVCALAELHGWTWFHDTDSRRNAAGLPDLLLLRERLVFAEIKKEGGRLTPAQKAFHARLKVAGVEVYVWFPSAWALIEETLRERRYVPGGVTVTGARPWSEETALGKAGPG